MLKNIIKLEHEVGEKSYQFLCENDSPIASIKEALVKFLQYVGQIEDQIKANQPSVEPEKEPVAEEPNTSE